MNKAFLSVSLALLCATVRAAWPEVTNTRISQDANNHVTVTYDLAADGFVTVDFLTNGIPIKAVYAKVSGDVNGLVAGGRGKAIRWVPSKDFAGGTIKDVQARVCAWHPACPPDYMSVDLVTGAKGYYATSNAIPGGVMDERYRKTALLLRRIPAAGREWTMGCPPNSVTYGGARQTGHRVVLSNDFYMTVFPVTQRQFALITPSGAWNPSKYDGEDRDMHPVENINYENIRGSLGGGIDWPATGDAVDEESVIQRFRDRTGLLLDLPLDAQYEFACRAGTTTDLYTGDMYREDAAGTNAVNAIAWCKTNAGGTTHVVGLLRPNGYGLYDMVGNVRSLCRDWYVEDLAATLGDRAYFDPVGGTQSEATIVGGIRRRVSHASHYSDDPPKACTSAFRSPETPNLSAPYIGFRLVCPAKNGGVR